MSTTVISMGGRTAVQLDVGTVVIRVLSGPDEGMVEVFEETPVVVGSDPGADLVLSDTGVSRRHFELLETPEGIRLRDLGSTNGTFLGGAKIDVVSLSEDAELQVGQTRLAVELRADPRVAFLDGTAPQPDGTFVGESPAFQAFQAGLRAAAPARASVLLFGESGTGKELAAKDLHALSGRAGELVVFDSSTADPTMLRSDLFGHVKGAFTGAAGPRDGAVRAADGGTLFLDEIGELPLDLQAHLLRVLEAREVKPLGSDKAYPVDVRVLAATHRDLGAMVREGTFRLDLFHRLSVVVLRLPALRERLEDLRGLVTQLQRALGTQVKFAPSAWQAMAGYSWPGNIRELRNVVERASVIAANRLVEAADLSLGLDSPEAPSGAVPGAPGGSGLAPMEAAAQEGERAAIQAALAAESGVRTRAAQRLGISVATLWRRMKQYDL